MRRDNWIVLLRLFLGTGLFLLYMMTKTPLPDFAIPAFLLYLVLLQLTAYFGGHAVLRTAGHLSALILMLLLSVWHPPMFAALAVFWWYEIIRQEKPVLIGLFAILFLGGSAWLITSGSLLFEYKDLIFLAVSISFMAGLRVLREQNRLLDNRILLLTQSARNLELEQKRTRTHMDQLRELYTLEERNRISRDLHDSVGHTLSAIRIQLEAIATVAESGGPAASAMARKLAHFAEDGLQRLRDLLHEMKPPRYSEQALMMGLLEIGENFSTMSGVQVHITASSYRYRTPYRQDQLIRYALQEFLSNAARHGGASQVNVHLQYTETGLILTMKDNGTGSAGFKKTSGSAAWRNVRRPKAARLISKRRRVRALPHRSHCPKEGRHDTNHYRRRRKADPGRTGNHSGYAKGYDRGGPGGGRCGSRRTVRNTCGRSGSDGYPDAGCDGICGTRRIKQTHGDRVKVLILTTFQDTEYIREALSEGASGYLLKDSSYDIIADGIRSAVAGNTVFHPKVVQQMIREQCTPPPSFDRTAHDLTERELELILAVAAGRTNQEIADQLFLSTGTVKNAISVILHKLQLRDRTQLAIFAYQNGLL